VEIAGLGHLYIGRKACEYDGRRPRHAPTSKPAVIASSIFFHTAEDGTATQNEFDQNAGMWTDMWGIQGISPSKPRNSALLLWSEMTLN
jgi:hypothetical protein